jgi:hypothetical protein
MEEVYTFTARVVERGTRQIQIVPEEQQALLDYFERVNLSSDIHRRGDVICVSVARQALVQQSENAERVRYSVHAQKTRHGRQLWGLALEAL